MKQLAVANLVASLVSMVILIAVAAKLQVAKDEAAAALKNLAASPFQYVMGLFGKGA